MIFKFGGQLQPVEIEEWEAERSPAVFVTDARCLLYTSDAADEL